MNEITHRFLDALTQRRRVLRLGMLLHSLLRIAGYSIIVLMGYVFLDFFLSFPKEALIGIDVLLLGWLATSMALLVRKILVFSARDTACHVDRLVTNRRRSILGALELQNSSKTTPSGIQGFFISKSIHDGCAQLEKTPLKACFPASIIRKQLKIFLVQFAIIAVFMGTAHSIHGVILKRIFFPERDLPPWSPYVFTVTPDNPKVLYGGTLELSVNVTGHSLKSPVVLLTRRGDKKDRMACFQENASHFTQHLENLVEPLEFCFATGKARSPWQKIDLLLQPQISLAKIEVTPPAYTLLPKKEWIVGKEEISALAGSQAVLFITSNRPLSNGFLTINPTSGIGTTEVIKGEKTANHTFAFKWNMRENSQLQVDIRDVQGTPTADKLILNQKILPDKPPEIALSEPSSTFVLATPHSMVPISGQATDDFGLREVRVVRSIVGYRDRLKHLSPENIEKDFAFNMPLDLKDLGVEEGQVLEVYLEAKDTNPTMTGLGSSEIIRIQIISEDEYANILRRQITVKEFTARFSVAQERLQEFLKALHEIKEESQKPNRDNAHMEELLKKANSLSKEIEYQFSKMAADFTVYDKEEELRKNLLSAASLLNASGESLSQMKPADSNLSNKMDDLLKNFEKTDQQLTKQADDAKELANIGAVMQQSAAFKNIVNRQKDLVRKLQRFESSIHPETDVLSPFSEQQKEIREELDEFCKNLTEAAGKLQDTEDNKELRKSAMEFCDTVQQLRIPPVMNDAVTAGKNQNGRKMHQDATLALEKLESMISDEKSSFGSMCKCRLNFKVRQDLSKTLGQMLNSIFSQNNGSGDNDGYSTGQQSELNTPAYGPDRARMSGNEGQSGPGKDGQGPGGRSAVVDPRSQERLSTEKKKDVDGEGFHPERVPEKYRDAVKKYFSP